MKIHGTITKYYNNVDPTEVDATNYCVKCETEFSKEHPCCCDFGCNEDGSLHYNGRCFDCCKHPGRYGRHIAAYGSRV